MENFNDNRRGKIPFKMQGLRLLFGWATLILLSVSCEQFNAVFNAKSPRESYKKHIIKSPLAQKPIVKEWLAAGDSVLQHPVSTPIPLQTKIVYFRDEANAWAWQFSLKEGRKLEISLARSDSTQRVFMDLFLIKNGKPYREKSTEDSLISYQAEQNGTFILRVQAELLVNGSAMLQFTDQPSMAFPVQGGKPADIGGVFGDPRDDGARKHEGDDIFADRGTPALAVANGWVTRTGNHGLGGKQVWLRVRGKSIYYAHLDSIVSSMGEKVHTGDTLGFVGNTGNARTTPPHLHFGIYEHGAIDPLPFIDSAHSPINPLTADPAKFPEWGRITTARANLRPSPSTHKTALTSLFRNNPVKITEGTNRWYHVILPDGQTGFIYQTLVEPAIARLRSQHINPGDRLFSDFTKNRHGFSPDSSQTLNVFGTYQSRALVKYKDHWVWVMKE